MDTVKVGHNIDAWCTKCKLVLAHTVEAIALGVIKRVHCNTCFGKHQYKASQPGTKVKPLSAGRVVKPKKTLSLASDFSKATSGKDFSRAILYNTTRQFAKGELINHSKFGFGIVVGSRDAQKMEVLFPEGAKILVHARL
jgi:hypothetical protein